MIVPSRSSDRFASKEIIHPWMAFSVLILYVVDQALYHPFLWGFAGVGAAWGLSSQFKLKPIYKRGLLVCLGLAVLPVLLLNLWAEPGHAILLSDAQKFFASNLATAGNTSQATAVTMIFNICRGLYIFYLIVAVVAAWNTAQRDEDWLPVIKTPVMSLLGVFSIDIMTKLIIT